MQQSTTYQYCFFIIMQSLDNPIGDLIMSCFENNTTTVTPYVLCSLCRTFFELYTNSSSWDAIPRISEEDTEIYFPRFKHHDPGTALHASAENGCHLCALIDAAVNRLGVDFREKCEGCLVPDHPRKYPYNQDGCSRINIGIDLGANFIINIIGLHRHTNGRNNNERLPDPCYLLQKGLIEDSLETEVGWLTNTCSSSSFAMLRG